MRFIPFLEPNGILHKFLFSWSTPTTLYHLRLKETCPKKLRGKKQHILVPQWSFINEKHYANLIFQRITYKSYIYIYIWALPKDGCSQWMLKVTVPLVPCLEPLWTRVLATPKLWWVSGSCSNMLMNNHDFEKTYVYMFDGSWWFWTH